MDYKEKLRDGKWQMKRLEIMKRDDCKCRICGDTYMLNIHHIVYDNKYNDPWDYPDNMLICLCGKCHDYVHKNGLISVEARGGLSPFDFIQIYPKSLIAFRDLSNHKGDWTVVPNEKHDFAGILLHISVLKKFMCHMDVNLRVPLEYGELDVYEMLAPNP